MTNNFWRLNLRSLSRSETREHFTRSMRLLATIQPDCSWYSAVKTDLLTSDQSDHKADTDGYRSLCFAGTSTIPLRISVVIGTQRGSDFRYRSFTYGSKVSPSFRPIIFVLRKNSILQLIFACNIKFSRFVKLVRPRYDYR